MEENFIKVSVDFLDVIDEAKDYELQIALTLIYLTRLNYTCYGDSFLWTTAGMLIKQFGNYINIHEDSMKRQRGNFIDALMDLRSRGLIDFKTEKKKPSLKDELFINVKPLLDLVNKEPFVKLNVDDFLNIMCSENKIVVNKEEKVKNAVESYLLWMLFSIQGEWNAKNMATLKELEGEIGCYIGDKVEQGNVLANLTFVFSCSSIETLRNRKHINLPLETAWCCDDYASAYINRLIELDAIKVIKKRVKTDDGWRDMNFYYSPIFNEQDMSIMVRQWANRKKYAIKQREQEEKPVVKKAGSFVTDRRRRFRY